MPKLQVPTKEELKEIPEFNKKAFPKESYTTNIGIPASRIAKRVLGRIYQFLIVVLLFIVYLFMAIGTKLILE
jgi:hypothetical protein